MILKTFTIGARTLRAETHTPDNEMEAPYRLVIERGRNAGLGVRLLRNEKQPHLMFGLAETEPFSHQFTMSWWFTDRSGELELRAA